MTFLTLSGIGKRYGDFTAVAGLDLSIEKGEFVSLLGPSGCGKTTTLQMIAGFVAASTGRITLDGQDITHRPPNRRGLGIVFQSYALFPHMTVRANVAFGLEMRGVAATARDERVARALALVHLDRFGGRYPRELSGGQRQRVALARALVIEPPVLLLDEPMSNLDAKLREDMQQELREIQRTVGTTTLMVTHDQAEALSMSDRVVVMEAGRVVQVATPREAYDAPANRFVSQFVGRANLFDACVVAINDVGAVLDVAGRRLQTTRRDLAHGERRSFCLRPELVRADETDEVNEANAAPLPGHTAALPGTIVTAMFLGNQWLHRIDTPIGMLSVVWPHAGRRPRAVGDAVRLRWPDEALHLLAHEIAHG
ncbi:MAG: ABC transporter ATP-binding protein [Janthinobacterium lividum]